MFADPTLEKTIEAVTNPTEEDRLRFLFHKFLTNLPQSELTPGNPADRGVLDAIPSLTDPLGQPDEDVAQGIVNAITQMPLAAVGSPIPAGALGVTVFHGTGLPAKDSRSTQHAAGLARLTQTPPAVPHGWPSTWQTGGSPQQARTR